MQLIGSKSNQFFQFENLVTPSTACEENVYRARPAFALPENLQIQLLKNFIFSKRAAKILDFRHRIVLDKERLQLLVYTTIYSQ